MTFALSLAAAIVVVLIAVTVAVFRPERGSGTGTPALSGTGPIGVMAGVGAGGEDGGIEGILSRVSGSRVGVAVADTKGGAVRTFGDQAAFAAASTAKLITAVAYLQRVEDGEARLDERLGSYTAGFQLQAMINDSNNDSWLLLMDRLGHRRLTQFAASIGVTYDPLDNQLTPKEMALVLTKLYSGELLNPFNTAQLLGYMTDTNNEELIPAAASGPGITVYHKYGQLAGSLHDAALLQHRGATYALVIFTEGLDTTDEAARTQIIRDLTRTVVDALFPAA
jgi:beta-lactamase class A